VWDLDNGSQRSVNSTFLTCTKVSSGAICVSNFILSDLRAQTEASEIVPLASLNCRPGNNRQNPYIWGDQLTVSLLEYKDETYIQLPTETRQFVMLEQLG